MSGDREPWVAVKIGAVRHPKVLELPNDSARWGLMVLWSEAKRQRPSGIFRSEVVARELLGRFGRFLPAYLEGGFLHRAPVECQEKRCAKAFAGLPSPALVVHDWHNYQRDHALRQLTYLASDTGSDAVSDAPSDTQVTSPHARVSTVDSTYSDGVGSGEGLPNLTPDAVTFLEGMTGRHIRQSGDKNLAEYDRQIGDHGLAKVIAAYRAVAKGLGSTKPTARQLVWSGRDILEPFLKANAAAKAERDEDADLSHRRRLEATQARIAALKGATA